ncbi:MAG: plectin 1 isoform 8 [Candidatus Ozemobacter sibiricus]|uniref:Plectin 1 isoform 8 n=1 Tax=Candidatus Ozemobacter sibiricus TaxID=2268124 RepID=A0A367ZJ93_9BACT|nr:MAG: plectin 1 isoform 8 [Candidatus Ozemobacter sibiricus]
MARKNRIARTDPDPEDILQGRRSATLDELIRLIHRVNPTGQRLSPAETATRYRQKALLQSLMIRRFPDCLTVDRPDPAHPDLIGLRRTGFFDDDACHALIGELDPEAQDWVVRQLDQAARNGGRVQPPGRADRLPPAHLPATPTPTAATARPARPPTATTTATPAPTPASTKAASCPADPGEALELGRQALAAYDFETCESCGRAALQAAPADPAAALLLLELFVDHLADHEQALAIGDHLPPTVVADPRVTTYLVLAETRAGRAADALARARRAGRPAPAEVLLAAGRSFLEQGDLERAGQCLRELDEREDRPDLDPADWREQRETLRQALRAAEADRLAPLEQPIKQALAEGRLPEAKTLAEALLAAHPGNRTAAQALREIEARQRQERIQSCLDAAEAARRRDDPDREAEALRRAIAAGAPAQALQTRLEAAQTAARTRRAAEMVRRAAELLACPPGTDGLRLYLDLEESHRQMLREQTADPRLPWLERLAFPRPAARPEALVEAVQALGEAARAMDADAPPERVLALLAPHADVWQALPEARELSRRVSARQRDIRAAQAREALSDAARHLEASRLSEARAALDRLDREAAALLSPPDQERLETLRRRAETLEAWDRLTRRYAAACDRGDLFAARRLAMELATAGDPAQADDWRARAANHEVALANAWCLTETPCQDLPPFFAALGLCNFRFAQPAIVLPDGQTVVVASSHDRWVFLRLFSKETQTCRKAILLRTPRPVMIVGLTFGDGSLWITGEKGIVLEISLSPLSIRSWWSASSYIPEQDIIEEVLVAPEERLVWIDHRRRGPDIHYVLEILDLDGRKPSCRVPVSGMLRPLPASQGNLFTVDCFSERGMAVFSASGKPLGSFPFPMGKAIYACTIHPNGRDFVFLTHSDLDDEPPTLFLEIRPLAGEAVPPFCIEGSNGELDHQAFTSLDTGLVYVLMGISDEQSQRTELAAFRLTRNRWAQEFRVEVPRECALLPEPGIRRVTALSWSGGRLQAVTLGSTAPVLTPPHPAVSVPNIPTMRGKQLFCQFHAESRERVEEFLSTLVALNPRKVQDMIRDMKVPGRHPPEDILAFRDALVQFSLSDEAGALTDWLVHNHPDSRVGRLLAAEKAAQEEDWATTRRLLEDLPRPPNAPNSCHHCHLLGLALYHAGLITEAMAVWKEGEEEHPHGLCHLGPLLEFAAQRSAAPDPTAAAALPGTEIQARFAAAIEDERWAEACSMLWERPAAEVWNVQILARLAMALLAQTFPPGSLDDLLKIVALALFQEALHDTFSTREVALHPSVEEWPPERIAAIDTQASQWLEARAAQS